MTTHELKVLPPYFDALVSQAKTFEVRVNDRAYQTGDILRLREWHPRTPMPCPVETCSEVGRSGHWHSCREVVERRVSFVYAGDPRFGGLEPGYVILGLELLTDWTFVGPEVSR